MKIFHNPVKRKLKRNEIVVGSWIAMGHPWVADIMGQCGFEFLVADLEHGAMGLDALSALYPIIELHGAAPMARLSSNDPVQAKRALDAGAYGLIFPMVNTPEDARRAVESVKYPPLGTRGFGLSRAQDFGFGSKEYFERANEETMVILQIEHIDGVNNIEAILEVKGIDGILVGPYDLSGSLGMPGRLDHPKVVEARRRAVKAARDRRLAAGMHIVHPDPKGFRNAVKEGVTFIAYGGDYVFLGESCRRAMAEIGRL